jgi:hypothetical protein
MCKNVDTSKNTFVTLTHCERALAFENRPKKHNTINYGAIINMFRTESGDTGGEADLRTDVAADRSGEATAYA